MRKPGRTLLLLLLLALSYVPSATALECDRGLVWAIVQEGLAPIPGTNGSQLEQASRNRMNAAVVAAAIGETDNGAQLARSIGLPQYRSPALSKVAIVMAHRGQERRARALHGEAHEAALKVDKALRRTMMHLLAADLAAWAEDAEQFWLENAGTSVTPLDLPASALSAGLADISVAAWTAGRREEAARIRQRAVAETENITSIGAWAGTIQIIARSDLRKDRLDDALALLRELASGQANRSPRRGLEYSVEEARAQILLTVATWHAGKGKLAEAIQSARAIGFSPPKGAALRAIANTVVAQARPDERLLKDLVALAEGLDDNAQVITLPTLAVALSAVGQGVEARRILASAASVEERQSRGRKNYDRSPRIAALVKIGDLHEAVALLDHPSEDQTAYSRHLDAVTLTLADQGKAVQAIEMVARQPDERRRQVLFGQLAIHLARRDTKTAVDLARSLTDSAHRSSVLMQLAARMVEPCAAAFQARLFPAETVPWLIPWGLQ